ncbi:MAG: 2-oxoacid:acceptor oxidoreductase subunit alpha [Prevotellaceae bacterium]|jgi:2-oxoglutarate ferredoxin oxidoreductase subunit alpha|nr:2-oxoacid:acceptor oxidoreductase subunit alpha [Prevotellaceae bacterium]
MNENLKSSNNIVIKFSGDSGDGMQLAGTMFSNISAILGNEISTFPDYPAEIRAPQGTVGGVSGFQVHIGSSKVWTPGDEADVLVAMNPAALKVNAKQVKQVGAIIYDTDTFTPADLRKAEFSTENPFDELKLMEKVQLVPVPLTSLTKKSLENFDMDSKSIIRSKNMFALGLICWLFNEPIDKAIHFLESKFAKKQNLLTANIKVLTDGFNYGNNLHMVVSPFHVYKSQELEHGVYTSVSGNKATAWGLIAAAEKAGLSLFLGSYPITPATDIMHELALCRDMGVKVMQTEDEIAGITTAIGASFAGALACTSTSGPGLALKAEALGLAVMAELPLVLIDVMRVGPSTGMPTKTEQADLQQALNGRNGECPLVVLSADTPANCFKYAYQAAKIALEHSTPVILLTDAFIGNGSSLWKLPKLAELPEIKLPFPPESMQEINAVSRDPETLVRYRAVPGTPNLQHRIGGLEKHSEKGSISTDPENHEKMIYTRLEKIKNVPVPCVQVEGNPDGELLVIGWGSTYGHLISAVNQLNSEGKKLAMAQFNYIFPLPANTADVLNRYKKIVVCELNTGQFAGYLRASNNGVTILQYNKIQGQPFTVHELVDHFKTLI